MRWYRRLDKLGAEKASCPKDLRCRISGFSVAELWEQHRESEANSRTVPEDAGRAPPPLPETEPFRPPQSSDLNPGDSLVAVLTTAGMRPRLGTTVQGPP